MCIFRLGDVRIMRRAVFPLLKPSVRICVVCSVGVVKLHLGKVFTGGYKLYYNILRNNRMPFISVGALVLKHACLKQLAASYSGGGAQVLIVFQRAKPQRLALGIYVIDNFRFDIA